MRNNTEYFQYILNECTFDNTKPTVNATHPEQCVCSQVQMIHQYKSEQAMRIHLYFLLR